MKAPRTIKHFAGAFLVVLGFGILLACPLKPSAQNLSPIGSAYAAFNDGDFERAWQLFGRLAIQYPGIDSIQLYYAASIVESGREADDRALVVLDRYKALNGSDPLEHLLRGRVAHHKHDFELALSEFKAYESKVSDPASLTLAAYYRSISEQAQRTFGEAAGKYDIKEHRVIRARGMTSSLDFHLSYGSFRPVPESLRSTRDVRLGYEPPAFFHPASGLLFFSSYGDGDQTDLYQALDAGNGSWKKPVRLDQVLNSAYAEYAAWMGPDAKQLYFSSKRRSTLGGFDIFTSKYDPERLQWSEPENIGLTFNTLDDEFLFFPADIDGLFVLINTAGLDIGLVAQMLIEPIETTVTVDIDTTVEPVLEQDSLPAVKESVMINPSAQVVNQSGEPAKLPIYRLQLGVTLLGGEYESDIDLPGTYLLNDSLNNLSFLMYGKFRFYAKALEAKDSLLYLYPAQSMLIVAYNGKERITFRQAMRMEEVWGTATYREYPEPEIEDIILTPDSAAAGLDSLAIDTLMAPDTIESGIIPDSVPDTLSSPVKAEPSGQVAKRQGTELTIIQEEIDLYYSVQIGVFRNYKTARDLRNPPDLLIDTLESGLFRYRVGEYSSYEACDSAAKHLVASKIALDTILLAFYKGNQITASAARKIEQAMQGSKAAEAASPVYFAVMLCAVTEDSEKSLARLKAEYPGIVISIAKDESGDGYLMTGNFNDYNEARKHLMIDIQPFLPDARVTGIDSGKIIPVMKAIQLLGN